MKKLIVQIKAEFYSKTLPIKQNEYEFGTKKYKKKKTDIFNYRKKKM